MNYYVPSFKYERKTGAFNRTIYGFVALISIITTLFGVLLLETLVADLLKIITTVLLKNMMIIVWILYVPCVFLSVHGIVKFCTDLMISYKFEGNRIIKGKITKKGFDATFAGVTGNSSTGMAAAGTVAAIYAGLGMSATTILNSALGARGIEEIYRLIGLNMTEGFAEAYFDTDVYKKKIYTNVSFVKETKYCLHYKSDNGRLVIPKIYKDIARTYGRDKIPVLLRVVIRSAVIFAVFFALGCVDLTVGFLSNSEIKSSVATVYEPMDEEIVSYGYELYQHTEYNDMRYVYHKKVEKDGTSITNEVTLIYATDGSLKEVELNVCLPDESYLPEAEYLVGLVVGFSDSQKAEFMEYVEKSLEEGFSTETYCTMTGSTCTMLNSLSRDCIQILTR